MPLRKLLLAAALLLACAPAAQAATPFTLGPGDRPDVAVDSAGTAHVVGNENGPTFSDPDVLHYCQIPPGGSACTHHQALSAPLKASGLDSYVFAPGAGRVIVESYRCCTSSPPGVEGNYAFQSTDGGITFDPGKRIGDIDHEEGAVFGGEAISGATTTTFQRMPLGGPPPSTTATFDAGFTTPTHAALGLFGGAQPVQVMSDGDHTSFVKLMGGDPNSSASWTPAQALSPPGDEPLIASGPKGLVLLYTIGTPGANRLVARKFDGTSFSAPVNVSEKGDPIFAGASADPVSGRFHAVWVANGVIPNEIRWSYSDDGTTWSTPQTVLRGPEADNAYHLRVSAGPDGKGLVVWDQNSRTGVGRAAWLDPGENGDATTPSDTVTVDDGTVSLLAPGGCVNPGVPITLRVTHKTKLKLSPKKKVKILYVIFSVDKKKKTDKKAAFKATFKTKGFKAPSKHKLRARVRLKPVKGKGKAKTKVLKGTLKICG